MFSLYLFLVDHTKENCKNGQWNTWSEWSTNCTKTCGGGHFTRLSFNLSNLFHFQLFNRLRKCDNPKPTDHGLTCPGGYHNKMDCNMEECPTPGTYNKDYRETF